MKKINFTALCALSLILALAATFLPFKPTNLFAEDSAPPNSSDSSPPDSTASPDSTRNVPTCKDDYEYVESVGKCYKKCQDGWERNPETNRCRKIRTEAVSENAPAGASPVSNASPNSSAAASPDSTSSSSATSKSDTAISDVPICKDGYEYVKSADKCYKKCQDGWERNPETNRCRKTPTESEYETESAGTIKSSDFSGTPSKSAETLAATSCKEGYEYVESAGKCYKKCQDGQVRNPETNRCKKAASGSDDDSEIPKTENTSCKEGYEYVESAGKCYKKCQDGYERNPETNRCRKAKDNSGADYGVDVPETGGSSSFIAGGAIIALIAAGSIFIAFQYRQEIKEFLKKCFKKSEKSL